MAFFFSEEPENDLWRELLQYSYKAKLVESGKLKNTTTIKNDCKRNNQKLGRRKR